jgi:type I restriction enzyme S subunit
VKPSHFKADGSLDYEQEGLSTTGLATARVVPAGSVLMVCIGATIGKCGYCDQDVTTNQQINALTPSDGSSHRFLYYQMLTESFQRSVMHGSGQATLPIINKAKWSTLSVRLPPTVADQKQIAAQLNALAAEIQQLRRHYEQKQAALAALKKSLLHEAFSGTL